MTDIPALVAVPASEMGNCDADVGDPPYAGVFTEEDGTPEELIGLTTTDELARLFAAAPEMLKLTAFLATFRFDPPVSDDEIRPIRLAAQDALRRVNG